MSHELLLAFAKEIITRKNVSMGWLSNMEPKSLIFYTMKKKKNLGANDRAKQQPAPARVMYQCNTVQSSKYLIQICKHMCLDLTLILDELKTISN